MNAALGILAAPTPHAWLEMAIERWRELLVDHANCEKKAASSALALVFAYPEEPRFALQFSRLAREELSHFERVQKLMAEIGVPFVRQRPGRYASGLRAALRSGEPGRQLDQMLAGALIEARSCERFALLAPRLPDPPAGFYAELERCEARHFEVYLHWAREIAPDAWQVRLAELAACEGELATSTDTVFRFHSGPPARHPHSARQLEERELSAVRQEITPLLVPGTEHDAADRSPLDGELVHRRPMSVPVDHRAHAGGPKRGFHGR
jgi:tRNA 2-(methylsulfanyl)-N6-isopentenyladenosine37 hydroxylase